MKPLRKAVEDYIALRRSLGFKLRDMATGLADFVSFLEQKAEPHITTALALEWAIDSEAVFDFLGHPSCLYVTDPEFRTIDLVCDLVRKAGSHASLVSLDAIAARVHRSPGM